MFSDMLQVNSETLNFTTQKDGYNVKFIGNYCQNCGVKWYGSWRTDVFEGNSMFKGSFNKDAQREIKKFEKINYCPLCGGKSSYLNSFKTKYNVVIRNNSWTNDFDHEKHPASSMDSAYESFLDFVWRELRHDELHNMAEEKKTAKKTADENVNTWNVPVSAAVSKMKDEIKASPEKLKNYISQLMQLESNIYALTERLAALYYDILEIKRVGIYKESLSLVSYKTELSNAEARLLEAKNAKVKIQTIEYPVPPVAPELKKAGLFNKAKIHAINEEMIAKYQKEIEIYNEKVEMCKAEEARAKEEAEAKIANNIEKAELAVQEAQEAFEKNKKKYSSDNSPAKTLQTSVENEICEAENMLKKTLECRNKLYSYDIVFEKYRNMVAIFTFYEYLASGRCDSLDGTNGAYNLYENEVRANIIIDKLSTIIEKLEDVKQNQYMISSELKKVDQSLSKLNDMVAKSVKSLNAIKRNTELTAYNTAVTAYYAQRNVELTNALGYLVAFK